MRLQTGHLNAKHVHADFKHPVTALPANLAVRVSTTRPIKAVFVSPAQLDQSPPVAVLVRVQIVVLVLDQIRTAHNAFSAHLGRSAMVVDRVSPVPWDCSLQAMGLVHAKAVDVAMRAIIQGRAATSARRATSQMARLLVILVLLIKWRT